MGRGGGRGEDGWHTHLEAFLKAVLLLPRSVTADFNFPKWHYFGRGPGWKRRHFEYSLVRAPEGPVL